MTAPSRSLHPRAAALLAATACAFAFAQPAAPLPAMQSQGAVKYVCGGVGIDESSAMRAAMKSHPLSLLFAAASGGAYQADARVEIRDASGNAVLTTRAGGPVCLIDLPAGRYSVEAAVEGAAPQKRSTTVGGAPVTLDFRF